MALGEINNFRNSKNEALLEFKIYFKKSIIEKFLSQQFLVFNSLIEGFESKSMPELKNSLKILIQEIIKIFVEKIYTEKIEMISTLNDNQKSQSMLEFQNLLESLIREKVKIFFENKEILELLKAVTSSESVESESFLKLKISIEKVIQDKLMVLVKSLEFSEIADFSKLIECVLSTKLKKVDTNIEKLFVETSVKIKTLLKKEEFKEIIKKIEGVLHVKNFRKLQIEKEISKFFVEACTSNKNLDEHKFSEFGYSHKNDIQEEIKKLIEDTIIRELNQFNASNSKFIKSSEDLRRSMEPVESKKTLYILVFKELENLGISIQNILSEPLEIFDKSIYENNLLEINSLEKLSGVKTKFMGKKSEKSKIFLKEIISNYQDNQETKKKKSSVKNIGDKEEKLEDFLLVKYFDILVIRIQREFKISTFFLGHSQHFGSLCNMLHKIEFLLNFLYSEIEIHLEL
ncbi:hypothetical protein EDEG_00961 [Edhazardia aedis USNM 41457]|uniref:Uncharacterized protein n=1 Tax=Edhazardia aedis (strain USNM 41457) TaxID=1003232 RepID=J9DU72_EDHAE|nr:hypothetical protein EDEG_00961 [Edhazardia aedis USNM 41457]|eukprot:EJW04847.1 hypothetical protein EDEG_00961 [Edhazardia aedis USNM 41457]